MNENIVSDLLPLATTIERLDLMPGNPRRGDVAAVMRSLETFGQHKPVVVRRLGKEGRGVVLAGNHTLMAARELGWDRIAAVWVDDDERLAKARSLADNRTGDLGDYDTEALLAMLTEVHADLDLFEATAFNEDTLARLIASMAETPEPPDEPKIALPEKPKTRLGDLYELGEHRLLCGDCRDETHVARLLGTASVNLAFTSPPYADRRKYDEASGFQPVPPDDYVEWFAPVQANVAAHLADDGSWFVNIKPGADGLDTELYVFDLVLAHVREWGWHYATEFCWERAGMPGGFTHRFKNQFEPVYQFARGEWKMRAEAVRYYSENVPTPRGPGVLGKGSKDRKGGVAGHVPEVVQGSTWAPGEGIGPGLAYPGNRLPTFSATHEATGHNAAFPVGLPAFFIAAFTDEGDVVFDPFAGSGSTLVAAQQAGRVGYGIEISPGYCDCVCDRFERVTGIKARRQRHGRK